VSRRFVARVTLGRVRRRATRIIRAWDGSGNLLRPSGGRGRARLRYDFKIECREQGWGDPAFVYDEEKDLFRWTDGRFAFSREHADWKLLR
jgi:hypothetical protein